jgi:hypothetical protein
MGVLDVEEAPAEEAAFAAELLPAAAGFKGGCECREKKAVGLGQKNRSNSLGLTNHP